MNEWNYILPNLTRGPPLIDWLSRSSRAATTPWRVSNHEPPSRGRPPILWQSLRRSVRRRSATPLPDFSSGPPSPTLSARHLSPPGPDGNPPKRLEPHQAKP